MATSISGNRGTVTYGMTVIFYNAGGTAISTTTFTFVMSYDGTYNQAIATGSSSQRVVYAGERFPRYIAHARRSGMPAKPIPRCHAPISR